jgi:hypothetical protein
VRIFIFDQTAAIVRVILPRSFMVLLQPRLRRRSRLLAFFCALW